MKRFSLAFVLMLLFVLAACGGETPQDDDKDNGNGDNNDDQDIVETCDENQIEVEGECITLNAIEMRLYDTFNAMQAVTNYRMITTINHGDVSESFTLEWDGHVSKLSDANEDVYYIYQGGVCEEVRVQGTVETMVSVECDTANPNAVFYLDFEYHWFKTEDGTNVLKSEHLEHIESAMGLNEMWELQRLSLDVSQLKINEITLEFVHEEDTLTVMFEFKDYDDVSITLPEGAVSE